MSIPSGMAERFADAFGLHVMTKQQRIAALRQIVSDLWYQNPQHGTQTTMGPCATPGCNCVSRGSNECDACIVLNRAGILGVSGEANNVLAAIQQFRVAEGLLLKTAAKAASNLEQEQATTPKI